MRGLRHAGRAGRAGRAGDAAGVEQHQQRVALAAGEGQVRVAGQPVRRGRCRGSPLRRGVGRPAPGRRRDEVVAQRGDPRGVLGLVLDGELDGRARSRRSPGCRWCRSGCRAPGRRRAAAASTSSSRRTTSAPTPYGPPTLCAVSVSASTPLAAKSTGTWPTACTASVCTGMPCACASSTTSATGWTRADLVVGPHHRDQRDAVRVALERRRAARRRRGGRARRPAAARPRRPRARPASAAGRGRRGARPTCDRMRVRRGSCARRAQKRPLSARLSDSVPPEVNTTSPGRQPSARAIVSRDSSTTRRAARPEACSDDGLPRWVELRGHRRDGLGVHRRGGRVVEVDGVGVGHCVHQRTACRGSALRSAPSSRRLPAGGPGSPAGARVLAQPVLLRSGVEQRPHVRRGRCASLTRCCERLVQQRRPRRAGSARRRRPPRSRRRARRRRSASRLDCQRPSRPVQGAVDPPRGAGVLAHPDLASGAAARGGRRWTP